MKDNIEQNENKVLGDGADYSKYPKQYDPSVLQRELRQNNRTYLNIDSDNLPFTGYDVWNCYEMTTLTKNGLPITGVLKIVYPASSKYIVESKSLKLFQQSWAGTFAKEVHQNPVRLETVEIIKKDLSELLEIEVEVKWFSIEEIVKQKLLNDFLDYEVLENINSTELSKIVFKDFKENPELLKDGIILTPFKKNIVKVSSSLLKSACKITKQSDFGDIFIYMESNYGLSKEQLLKYIVSFRNEYHFHEEIVECIYKRLHDLCSPSKLLVSALYERRGGIDINPVRTNDISLLPENLINPNYLYPKTIRQ
jgi:7-cyano-7-deazaguanine reductase